MRPLFVVGPVLSWRERYVQNYHKGGGLRTTGRGVCVDLLTGGESLYHDGVSTHRPVLSPHLEAALNKIKFLVT
jgi:hypothetical protein